MASRRVIFRIFVMDPLPQVVAAQSRPARTRCQPNQFCTEPDLHEPNLQKFAGPHCEPRAAASTVRRLTSANQPSGDLSAFWSSRLTTNWPDRKHYGVTGCSVL